jgi:predicted RNA-binding protein YlxR (DUF448 family)
MAPPVRTCVGCGRKAPQAELVRFVARAGKLERSRSGGGRGAYLCPQESCFERALRRNGFGRALRVRVAIEPGERPYYTDGDGERQRSIQTQ